MAPTPGAVVFANCTALRKVYPHGVGLPGAANLVSGNPRPGTNFHVDAALYQANITKDRDKDGIACEN